MAVYREGYHILKAYEQRKHQIWNDSCDEGVAVSKDDANYNLLVQLTKWYGDPLTRKHDRDLNFVSIIVTLMDEWAVSDERKTLKEAIEKYKVSFFKFDPKGFFGKANLIKKGFTYGFFNIERVKSDEDI